MKAVMMVHRIMILFYAAPRRQSISCILHRADKKPATASTVADSVFRLTLPVIPDISQAHIYIFFCLRVVEVVPASGNDNTLVQSNHNPRYILINICPKKRIVK